MRFFRRDRVDFYKLLATQARKVQDGMNALVEYMKHPSKENGQAVLWAEEAADDLRRDVVDELNKAFVTPIDREDIYQLSRSVDDVLDYAKSTVEEMLTFEVKPNSHLVTMSEGLAAGAEAIAKAIENLNGNSDKSREFLVYAKKRENFVEHCYREALVELFKQTDVVNILKVREIYRHLSNAADRSDEAANIIGNILVKVM